MSEKKTGGCMAVRLTDGRVIYVAAGMSEEEKKMFWAAVGQGNGDESLGAEPGTLAGKG